MRDFVKVLQFETKEGDTIFHLMAGVCSHQSFFAQEMIDLSDALYPGKFIGSSLGDVKISIPDLEDTELIQIIDEIDMPALLSLVDNLEKGPAIKWIQNIHARLRENGQSFKGSISRLREIREGILFPYVDRTVHNIKINRIIYQITKYTGISNFLFKKKNNKGLLPKDVAYKSGNLPAYTIIEERIKKDNRRDWAINGFAVGFLGGVVLGISGNFVLYDYLNWLSGVTVFLGSTAGGSLAGSKAPTMCYNIFHKIKKSNMEKRSSL
ncbi:MAG: hypothetical protein OXN83_05040 [Oligoflexia bacterium]|nr:hypothetical protein [Oligoflexia bacterium]